ncbi:MAG: thioredoxin [Candidatus Abyssobacteria bacterium SURF_5]|uniref:Thioredoxin n=1 Tax=Abyssobacteria bacterium (strain SURF_5) TaxID=2093360 RepID=A0A3A4NQE1_ABYX5|nr:MAG: thioredoxin [Candidatus Abyssubacteria bacterium SURF_5]
MKVASSKFLLRTIFMFCLFFLVGQGNSRVCAAPTVYPTGTTINDPAKTYVGYTLFQVKNPPRIVLIDMAGQVVHSWESQAFSLHYAEALPNGNILANAETAELNGLVELDWDGNIVWSFVYDKDLVKVHHDFERLTNGNTLILCKQTRTVPTISPLPIRDDYIIEVDPSGAIVWEWHTCDHYAEFGFNAEARELIAETGGDWAHTNSISTLPPNSLGDSRLAPGNILVSQRHTNIIYVIAKATGQITWKCGPDDNLTIGQHDAEMIPEPLAGAGNILVFDNGGLGGYPYKFRMYSRVLEIDPLQKIVDWSYNAAVSGLHLFSFFSPFISSAQRLPNGNTMIDEGESGRIFEVTPEGEIVWEYVNPIFFQHFGQIQINSLYRAYRTSPDWPLLP